MQRNNKARFTRRTAAALTGAAACTLLLAWLAFATEAHFFLYPLVGIPTCVGVGWLVSRLP